MTEDVQSLRLAIAQTGFGSGAPEANLAGMADLAARAAGEGARLLVFPELVVAGYGPDARPAERAEPYDGPSFRYLSEVAGRLGVALCYGYAERAGEAVYDSAALIGPDGRLLANHRKTHLYGDYERSVFSAGESPATLTELEGFRVALLVCYEVEFPEMVRPLALAGAELVLVPTATDELPNGENFVRTVVGARATENNLFVAYANHCGRDGAYRFIGHSMIAGPQAAILALAGSGETLLTAEIGRSALDEGRRRLPYLSDRRAELYRRD